MSDVADRMDEVDQVMLLIRAELEGVVRKHRRYASAHEGFGVLYEEVDEVWDEVKANRPDLAVAEAIQVAAVAVRFVADICARHGIPLPAPKSKE